MEEKMKKIVSVTRDEYGNLLITFSDGTSIGGAIAEEYAYRVGLQ